LKLSAYPVKRCKSEDEVKEIIRKEIGTREERAENMTGHLDVTISISHREASDSSQQATEPEEKTENGLNLNKLFEYMFNWPNESGMKIATVDVNASQYSFLIFCKVNAVIEKAREELDCKNINFYIYTNCQRMVYCKDRKEVQVCKSNRDERIELKHERVQITTVPKKDPETEALQKAQKKKASEEVDRYTFSVAITDTSKDKKYGGGGKKKKNSGSAHYDEKVTYRSYQDLFQRIGVTEINIFAFYIPLHFYRPGTSSSSGKANNEKMMTIVFNIPYKIDGNRTLHINNIRLVEPDSKKLLRNIIIQIGGWVTEQFAGPGESMSSAAMGRSMYRRARVPQPTWVTQMSERFRYTIARLFVCLDNLNDIKVNNPYNSPVDKVEIDSDVSSLCSFGRKFDGSLLSLIDEKFLNAPQTLIIYLDAEKYLKKAQEQSGRQVLKREVDEEIAFLSPNVEDSGGFDCDLRKEAVPEGWRERRENARR